MYTGQGLTGRRAGVGLKVVDDGYPLKAAAVVSLSSSFQKPCVLVVALGWAKCVAGFRSRCAVWFWYIAGLHSCALWVGSLLARTAEMAD